MTKTEKLTRAKRPPNQTHDTKMSRITNFVAIMIFLILASTFYLVISFKPLTKEEQIAKMAKVNSDVEPFRQNISECAREVRASMKDVEQFLKRIPQNTFEGKCFVACIMKRNSIIRLNKISREHILDANRVVFGEDSELMERLEYAVTECGKVVEDIFEICEYASTFNDCMHTKMEHILEKVTMERRMEALGQINSNDEEWTENEDEIMQLLRDEL